METTRVNDVAYRPIPRLYMALETSERSWVVLFSAGNTKLRLVKIAKGDRAELHKQIELARAKLGVLAEAPVVSCYEAGRDGFWIHRWLLSIGVRNTVIDSASIEVKQRGKRLKTDRVDVHKLMNLLLRFYWGERDAWREVRVPSAQQEDQRRLHRERERLLKERDAIGNRIGSLLATQGVRMELSPGFEAQIEQIRCWDGAPLGPQLSAELRRMWHRRQLIGEQIRAVEHQQREELARSQGIQAGMGQLMQLRSMGIQTPWVLCSEILGWRNIRNRRELGALAGLTPTPYSSGDSEREQGISKSGNRRVRKALVEVAWLWLRHQPASALSRWFEQRFGATGSKRSRRIGIVALARKLLVALWRFLHDGVVPEGARFKTA